MHTACPKKAGYCAQVLLPCNRVCHRQERGTQALISTAHETGPCCGKRILNHGPVLRIVFEFGQRRSLTRPRRLLTTLHALLARRRAFTTRCLNADPPFTE